MNINIRENSVSIQTAKTINALQAAVDQAEKESLPSFTYFNDADVVSWYLYTSDKLLTERSRSKRTTKSYEREIKQFIQYIYMYQDEMGLDVEWQEQQFLRSLSPRHLRKYQEWLVKSSPYVKTNFEKKKPGYSVATLTTKTTILKQFFRFLYDKKYISEPLHEGLKSISVNSDDRPNRDMGTEDVVRVLEAFIKTKNIFAFTIVQLLVATGIRNEELCTLQIKSIKRNINGEEYLEILGKGNKRRDVPLKSSVKQSIIYYRQARNVEPLEYAAADSPLIPTKTGAFFSASYLTQTLCKEMAKIQEHLPFDTNRITPHIFRHAFAIISHENDVSVHDIMRSLGHERLDTTMIYLEKIFDQERHASHQWTNAISNYL
ncbi:tyrosine-type recombinase/integrase [Lysinibacillus sphaericus]|uniref:tyrosine-type recombinase/integrase n=1 Tax=Lysinibacillus sphaericus TaxID=1421 RepID=UPI0015D48601|nr:tyrosine-type recombinase/integrase [Lysinibacillus sphaericus]